jgi:hypothetical protein
LNRGIVCGSWPPRLVRIAIGARFPLVDRRR